MTIAITGATMIDGTGANPVASATVVIEGERILSARAANEPPRGTQVIDGAGCTLMPGMIDCHVHLFGKTQPLQPRLLTPPSLELFHAAQNGRRTLESGITSVRDAGGAPLGLKMAVERGLIPGPRMRISVVALSQTGGHMDQTMPSGVNVRDAAMGGFGAEWPPCVCDGPDEARATVRAVLRAGADVIKLCATGGVLSPADEPAHTQFTVEEIAAMTSEAHAGGKSCMAHAHGADGIKNVLRAGVESIEHGTFLDEEGITMMKRAGAFLVPTISAPTWLLRYAERAPGSIMPHEERKTRESIERRKVSFAAALHAGVRIAMGTDAGVAPHGRNAEELALMVEAGMTPMDAIVAATKTAAECLRIDAHAGTLEPGKLADLLLVDGDPLDDIGVLQDRGRQRLIMQGGRIHKQVTS